MGKVNKQKQKTACEQNGNINKGIENFKRKKRILELKGSRTEMKGRPGVPECGRVPRYWSGEAGCKE